jgi:hypothetical protein
LTSIRLTASLVIPLLFLLLGADFSHQPHLTTAKLKMR